MNVICIWKVAARNTRTFIQDMRSKGKRQDSYATILNQLCGFNFFYETDEKTFGDISEFAAENISKSYNAEIRNYSINGL